MSRFKAVIYKGKKELWPMGIAKSTPLRVVHYEGPYDRQDISPELLLGILRDGKVVWMTCQVYDSTDKVWVGHSYALHMVSGRILIIDINGKGILRARSDAYGAGKFMTRFLKLADSRGVKNSFLKDADPELHQKLSFYMEKTCDDPKGGCSQYVVGYLLHLNGYL